jgi:hypothetical protein
VKKWKRRLAWTAAAVLLLLPLLSSISWWWEQKAIESLLDRYSHIREGDNRATVEALLGKPQHTKFVSGMHGPSADLCAIWRFGDARVLVLFEDRHTVRYTRCQVYRQSRGPLEFLRHQWRRWFSPDDANDLFD